MNKRTSILIGAILILVSGTALALVLPPRVSWNPSTLNPASIAPGTSASFQFTLTHTGILLPIAATNELKIVTEGNIAPFVTLTQPIFPPVFKRGNQVTISVQVSAPASTTYLRKSGQLVLQRVLPNGKVKEVWRADALPVQLTFSGISLPPYPDTFPPTTRRLKELISAETLTEHRTVSAMTLTIILPKRIRILRR